MIGLRNTATGQIEQVFPPDDFGSKKKAESAAKEVTEKIEGQVRDLSANPGNPETEGFQGVAHLDIPVGFELVDLADDFDAPAGIPVDPETPAQAPDAGYTEE